MSKLKQALKRLTPPALLRAKWAVGRWVDRWRYSGESHRDVFSEIYRNRRWGDGSQFCSGIGSANPAITQPYIDAVSPILQGASGVVVDLGCGDFKVGDQLYPHAPYGYIGVDVVEDLIDRHKVTYSGTKNLSFLCADLTSDPLPDGDIVLVRQVFQHLSNRAVQASIVRLRKYRMCIITEHQPAKPITINRDKSAGPRIRLEEGSGVYIDRPPFSVQGSFELLLEVPGDGIDPERSGYIRTYLWKPRHPHLQ